jgi:hypothetical protein
MALIHFLLAYDRAAGHLISQVPFTDAHEATEAYKQLEVEHRLDENVEIVLIGSDSIETVMKTHSNYFGEQRSIEDLLTIA